MKAKVLFRYVDKHTMEPHERGEIVELTEKRGKELGGLGFVEVIEEAKPAPKPRTRKTASKKGE